MFNSLADDFKNAFKRSDNSLMQFIIINVIVYVLLGIFLVVSKPLNIDYRTTFIVDIFFLPPTFSEFIYKPWTLFTYMFAHSIEDFFHILFNMLGLYWFGKLIMEYLGSKKFISLYILGGITGGLFFMLIYTFAPDDLDFINKSTLGLVGASAAVYAVVVAAATLVPEYTFFLLFLGPVKIKYIAAVYVFLSFLGTVGANAGGNIAHLGGAFIGFLFIQLLRSGTDLGQPIHAVSDGVKALFKPKPKIKVTYKKPGPRPGKPTSKNTIAQEEIDAILDKIAQSGYDKLSKEEKQKLFRASQKEN